MRAPLARAVIACLVAVAGLGAAPAGAAASAAYAQPVAVYPTPGDQYEQPATQITFRGIAADEIGDVTVVGSVTGAHSGQIEADSDGNGGSFVPDQPFASNETVTVTTDLDVIGGHDGSFSFRIENVLPQPGVGHLPIAGADDPAAISHFRSEPTLTPAAYRVLKDTAPASDGDIFVAPQFGPVQNGPMIIDPQGRLVWFKPFSTTQQLLVTNFQVQQLHGAPVLTWWQGSTNNGSGRGEGVILDQHYQQVAVVYAGNGLQADLHEFIVTNDGDAYLTAVEMVKLPGQERPVENGIVQEIDIATGLVLFQWDALDHIPLNDSFRYDASIKGHILSPYHLNSISFDPNGNLIVSARDTDSVFDINKATGQVIWEFGGRHSSFRMGPGTSTVFQHDAVMQPDGDLTIFDDGAGPPRLHSQSRGVDVALDLTHMTTRLVAHYDHTPALSAQFEGSMQPLPSGNVFLGWGQQPYFSEDDAHGNQVFDARFVAGTSSYRAYRFPWTGEPLTNPAVNVTPSPSGLPTVYASWNGETGIAAWRVLAGASADVLHGAEQVPWHGFETTMPLSTGVSTVEVQAIGTTGQVLGSSAPVAIPHHLQIVGQSLYASRRGIIGIPVDCAAPSPCATALTVRVNGQTVAQRGAENVPADGASVLFTRLSADGRAALERAGTAGLNATVSLSAAPGLSAQAPMHVVPFATSGPAPTRSATSTAQLSFDSLTDFVGSGGVGGQLLACHSDSPCPVTLTVSAGGRVIAQPGSVTLGARTLGYVIYPLNAAGRAMIAGDRGNNLAATVSATSSGGTATAHVSLVRAGSGSVATGP